jgi:hypothetical protein
LHRFYLISAWCPTDFDPGSPIGLKYEDACARILFAAGVEHQIYFPVEMRHNVVGGQ